MTLIVHQGKFADDTWEPGPGKDYLGDTSLVRWFDSGTVLEYAFNDMSWMRVPDMFECVDLTIKSYLRLNK